MNNLYSEIKKAVVDKAIKLNQVRFNKSSPLTYTYKINNKINLIFLCSGKGERIIINYLVTYNCNKNLSLSAQDELTDILEKQSIFQKIYISPGALLLSLEISPTDFNMEFFDSLIKLTTSGALYKYYLNINDIATDIEALKNDVYID